MERLHPIARDQKVTVDFEVAAVVAVCLGPESFEDVWLVQVFRDPVQLLVAQASPVGTLDADIVRVLSRALVRAYDGVVAVNGSGNAGPDAATIVAAFDEGFAAREGVVHGLAFALVENGGPASVAAGHGAVVIVLGQSVREAVADEH